MFFNAVYQLLQNILKSTEIRFPDAIMAQLHPDCIDMCRKLLRKDPGVLRSPLYGVVGFCRILTLHTGLQFNLHLRGTQFYEILC